MDVITVSDQYREMIIYIALAAFFVLCGVEAWYVYKKKYK